jgi:hypothetical protein
MSEGNGPAAIPRAANHAAYLRRLGYVDAADALEAADSLIPESEPDAVRGAPAPAPQRQFDPEAQRRAEGETLMAALRRDVPGLFEDR